MVSPSRFFAQLDIGAVERPNRRRVPVCPTPLDSGFRRNDGGCAHIRVGEG